MVSAAFDKTKSVDTKVNQKTVVITGASSGIGLGVARAYAAEGANVVLNSRTAGKLQDVAHAMDAQDRTAVVPGDIGQATTAQRLIAAAVDRFGGVDILVNNAGIFDPKPLVDYDESELDAYLSYLKGAYLLTQAAVRVMRNNGGGSIINITTVLASRGYSAIPSSAPVAAKGGIEALTQNLAVELAPYHIRVNTISPGLIKTPLHGRTDEQFDELSGMQPLGRVGEVKDVVDAVVYVANAEFVTGVVLPVDGGAMAGA